MDMPCTHPEAAFSAEALGADGMASGTCLACGQTVRVQLSESWDPLFDIEISEIERLRDPEDEL